MPIVITKNSNVSKTKKYKNIITGIVFYESGEIYKSINSDIIYLKSVVESKNSSFKKIK